MNKLTLNQDYKMIIERVIYYGMNYLSNTNLKALIIGISGGVDSAVVAALARKICDKLYSKMNLKLYGYYLHIDGNKPDEMDRAIKVGYAFCDHFISVPLTGAYYDLVQILEEDLFHTNDLGYEQKIRAGNIKARMRMIDLYNQASKHKGLVLSTDNLTEYYLGFWTLHGDVGDLGLIQSLWKTEVYGIAKLLGPELTECIDANPTDGLGITNSDIDQLLPYWTPQHGTHMDAYRKIDDILIDFMSGNVYDESNPVIQTHKKTHFKRQNPFNIERHLLIK